MSINRRDLLVSGGGAVAASSVARSSLVQNAPPPSLAVVPPAPQAGNALPDNERPISIVALRDLEAAAQKVMIPFSFTYVSGGAGDEWTMRECLAAFNRWVIMARFLSGHATADTATSVLGTKLSIPVITAVMGNQGSVHAQKEAPVVKSTALAGTRYVECSVSQLSLEEVAAASDGPKWLQIYTPESQPFAAALLHRARVAGYTAIVLTMDGFVTSNRERSIRLHGAAVPVLRTGNVPTTPRRLRQCNDAEAGPGLE